MQMDTAGFFDTQARQDFNADMLGSLPINEEPTVQDKAGQRKKKRRSAVAVKADEVTVCTNRGRNTLLICGLLQKIEMTNNELLGHIKQNGSDIARFLIDEASLQAIQKVSHLDALLFLVFKKLTASSMLGTEGAADGGTQADPRCPAFPELATLRFPNDEILLTRALLPSQWHPSCASFGTISLSASRKPKVDLQSGCRVDLGLTVLCLKNTKIFSWRRKLNARGRKRKGSSRKQSGRKVGCCG